MSTVIAVALGIAPVKHDGAAQIVDADYSTMVGRYSQSVDARGTTHLSGFDRMTGRRYELSVGKDGNVEGTVGNWYVSFQAADAG